MEWVCPECDCGEIGETGGYLLCGGCGFAFPRSQDKDAARLAAERNHHSGYRRTTKRVGRPHTRKETA